MDIPPSNGNPERDPCIRSRPPPPPQLLRRLYLGGEWRWLVSLIWVSPVSRLGVNQLPELPRRGTLCSRRTGLEPVGSHRAPVNRGETYRRIRVSSPRRDIRLGGLASAQDHSPEPSGRCRLHRRFGSNDPGRAGSYMFRGWSLWRPQGPQPATGTRYGGSPVLKSTARHGGRSRQVLTGTFCTKLAPWATLYYVTTGSIVLLD